MKLNKLALILALAIVAGFLTNNASAQTGTVIETPEQITSDSGTTYTVTLKFLDKYLGGNGSVFFGDSVSQADFFASFKNGVYVDFWGSRGGRGGWMEEFDSEWDATAGWSNKTFDLGVMYIAVSELAPSDVFHVYAKVATREFRGDLQGRLVIEYYFPTSSGGPEKGTITRLHLMQSTVFGRTSFDWRVGAFYDTGAFGFSSGTLAEGHATLLYDLKWLSVGPTLKVTTPIHLSRDDGREFDYAVGLVSQFTF